MSTNINAYIFSWSPLQMASLAYILKFQNVRFVKRSTYHEKISSLLTCKPGLLYIKSPISYALFVMLRHGGNN